MALAIAGLTGCATVNMDQSMTKLNETTASMTDKKVVLALNDEQRKQLRGQADALLKKPLNLNSTVELMLVNSPEFQALLARGCSESALAAQSGRIPNPIFNFELDDCSVLVCSIWSRFPGVNRLQLFELSELNCSWVAM